MATSRRGSHAGLPLASPSRPQGRRLAVERLEDRQLLASVPVMLTNLPLSGANITEAIQIGSLTFFTAYDDDHGVELWKTNGTRLGTMIVKDIRTGSPSSNPTSLTNVNGTLFFKAYDDTNGVELWKSDGTETGTVLVKDIYAGSVSSDPMSLTNLNGILYFTAYESTHGRELWKSDGTALGTVLIEDIRPGSLGSEPITLTPSQGILYFSAYENTHGRELWRSDGTLDGTQLVNDLRPGTLGSEPEDLKDLSGTLIFTADDGTHGRQFWWLTATLPSTSYVCNYQTPLTVTAADGLLAGTTGLTELALVSTPNHGSVQLQTDGSFVYTPAAGFYGTDSFSYRAMDDTMETNIATAQITVVQSLGTLTYSQQNVALTAEPRWYSFLTSRVGTLSLQATVGLATETAQIELYDADRSTLVGTAVWSNGVARLDVPVTVAGERYYVKLTGNSISADVRFANLLSQSGTTVNVFGCSEADTFAYVGNTLQTITINGLAYSFTSAAVTKVNFNGGTGSNVVFLEGTSGNEGASVYPHSAKFVVGTTTVNILNSSQVTITGNGGADTILMYDSAGDDSFVASPASAVLSGSGYVNTALGCTTVVAGATAGGNDTAQLSDSSGNDQFTAGSASATLQGSGFLLRANGFDVVTATSSAGGNDSAALYDSTGNDTFVGRPTESQLSGVGFSNRAVGFRSVQGIASRGGTDTAALDGSSGNDTLQVNSSGAALSGSSYSLRTRGFDTTQIDASQGGTDNAYLYASTGDDVLEAQSDWAQLSSVALSYQYRLSGFDWVRATAAAASNHKHVVTPLGYTLLTPGPWTDV